MKPVVWNILIASLLLFGGFDAFAASVDTLAAPITPQASKALTAPEINVINIALRNAGQACDAGIEIYCRIALLRRPILDKLTVLQAGQFPPASIHASPTPGTPGGP